MTDHSDDPRENGSPPPKEDESSMPIESPHRDAAPSAPPPVALPAASPSAASTPPMQPTGMVTGSVPTSWPTVVGILAIVFGGFGVLISAWGAVYPFVVERFAETFPPTQAQMIQQFDGWSGWSQAIAILSFLLAGLLIFGGISVVKRRHRAVSVLFIWSMLKIVLIFASVGVQLSLQGQVLDQAVAQLQPVPGGRAIMVSSMRGTIACSAIFQLAGPVFLLVWFRRRVIKEEVATWK